ncbi:MAG TPA: hypothetical protein VFX96_09055, partial [Pyrinomonadaceae bacterium]|nr:hypothetical protein [Pyrinomonadaceae bacterium]
MKREESSRTKKSAPHAAEAAAEATSDVTSDVTSDMTSVERRNLAALNSSVGVALVQGDTLREILQRCAEALVTHL